MPLKTTQLIGFGGSGSNYPVSIAATITGDSDSVDSTPSRTHTALDVGAGYSKKFIVGCITLNDNAAARTLSTFQLGGVNLSTIVTNTNNDGAEYLRTIIFGGDISSLSGSQSWTVTASGDVNSSAISAAVLHDLNSLTPLDSDTDMDGPGGVTDELFLSLNGDADGFAIYGAGNVLRIATASFSDSTERADVDTGGGSSDHRHAVGWDLGAGYFDQQISWSSSGEAQSGVAASFR
jgi:hypothetical protein